MTIKIDHLPSRTVQLDGVEHLFFSGTSYLGIGHQAEFRAALLDAISRYGTVFSASRNNNLQLKIYDEAETFLAKWTGADAALTVTSGLLAGQLAVQSIENQPFIYAPSAHPAICKPTAPPQYFFKNQTDFEKNIASKIAQIGGAVTVATNALDPLRCEPFDFSWLAQLPDNQPITVIVDDSHGIGLTGENGGGIFQKLKKELRNRSVANVRLIVIASLAKALGIPGGVILSDEKTVAAMRQNALFVGASPIVPAYLFAFLQTQNMYESARQVLKNNILCFKKELSKAAVFISENEKKGNFTEGSLFETLADYPVFFTQQNVLFKFLLQHKIMISSFSYPKPNDPPLTRIVLSALHSTADIQFLVEKIKAFQQSPDRNF